MYYIGKELPGVLIVDYDPFTNTTRVDIGFGPVPIHQLLRGYEEQEKKPPLTDKQLDEIAEIVHLRFPRAPKSYVANAFCPTGKGGGIDNTCSPSNKGQSGMSLGDAEAAGAEHYAKLQKIAKSIFAAAQAKYEKGSAPALAQHVKSLKALSPSDQQIVQALIQEELLMTYHPLKDNWMEDSDGVQEKLDKALGKEETFYGEDLSLLVDLAGKMESGEADEAEEEQLLGIVGKIAGLDPVAQSEINDKLKSMGMTEEAIGTLMDAVADVEYSDSVAPYKADVEKIIKYQNALSSSSGPGLSPDQEEELFKLWSNVAGLEGGDLDDAKEQLMAGGLEKQFIEMELFHTQGGDGTEDDSWYTADIPEGFTPTDSSEMKVGPANHNFPESLDTLEHVKGLGGSTGATLVRDPKTGTLYVKKQGNSPDHLRNEYRTEKLYEAAGVPVLTSKLYESGSPTKLSVYNPNLVPLGSLKGAEYNTAVAEVQKHFALDATFANWDVIGANMDNIMVDKETGIVYRIDAGGSLAFRAQGGLKLSAWNEDNNELTSMKESPKNPTSKKIFGAMTDNQVVDSITHMENHKDAIIKVMEATGVHEADKIKVLARINSAISHKEMIGAAASVHITSPMVSVSGPSVGVDELKGLVGAKKMGSDFAEKVAFLNPNGIEGGTVFVPMVGGSSGGSWKASNKEIIDHMKTVLPEGTKIQGVMVNKVKAGGYKISTKTEEKIYKETKSQFGSAPSIPGSTTSYIPGSTKVIPHFGGKITQNVTLDLVELGLPKHSVFDDESKYMSAHSKLPKTQLGAIRKFTGSSSSEIRRAFYAPDKSSGPAKVLATHMAQGLKKLPAYNGVVYRGLKDSTHMQKEIQLMEKAGIGGTWTDVAPHSMSRSQNKASNFAGNDHYFVIKTKTGKSVEHVSGHPHEEEIIGMPGARYRIVGIHKNATAMGMGNLPKKTFKTIVELEEI